MSKQFLIALVGFSVLGSNYACAELASNSEGASNIQLKISQLKYGQDFVVVGNISVNVTDTVSLKPDTAEFSITYVTEGETPNDASNRNVNNMKALTTFMESLGVSKDNLTTVAYRNYQNTVTKTVKQDDSGLYETIISVNAVIDPSKFTEAVVLLEEKGINNIEQQHYNGLGYYYRFVIKETASDAETTKKMAQQKLKMLESEFKVKGIAPLTVANYINKAVGPTTKQEKRYYVENTIRVKVTQFDNLGKIITKAQSLKMTVNNDMYYSVSEKAKSKVMDQLEAGLFEKLTRKGSRLLGTKNYQLGTPTSLYTTQSGNGILPRPRGYDFNARVLNAGQAQNYDASSVEIQPPSEFDVSMTMTGNFDIIKPVFKK